MWPGNVRELRNLVERIAILSSNNNTDNTNSIPLNSTRDAYATRLNWVEPWQLIDINNDGHMDIAGSSITAQPLVYYNDGKGNFEIHEIDHFKGIGLYTVDNESENNSVNGKPFLYEDFDQDGLFEYVTYQVKYFDDDDKTLIDDFSNEELDLLITCHMISEGVDIRSITSIILFSSDRQRLETVQRIGRALRKDPKTPTKRAKVLDFTYIQIPEEDSSDAERYRWLTELSKTRPGGEEE